MPDIENMVVWHRTQPAHGHHTPGNPATRHAYVCNGLLPEPRTRTFPAVRIADAVLLLEDQ